ncbi:MAG: flagellar hook assembly protein FlgD [Gammaproteobacteria bacterium]|nr:flagellar hook assembly protein FlgD [Gammaproteobacteria bacterium]MDH3768391.1 flagellar hook assembly protein FlgD [Gammaproteobacteria bacterium]
MPISNDIDLNALGLTLGSGSNQNKPVEDSEDTFLTLMMTQLRHQDPFQPLESGEFLSQLAQFETAAGVQGLQNGLSSLAESMLSNQVLESAALVGKTVFAEVSDANLGAGGTIEGAVDVPAGASSVVVEVRDSSGQIIRRMDFGALPAGRESFVWDGLSQSGEAVPPGDYSITASIGSGGENYTGRVLLADQVRSITLGGGGQPPILNLAGGGQISFAQILEIR